MAFACGRTLWGDVVDPVEVFFRELDVQGGNVLFEALAARSQRLVPGMGTMSGYFHTPNHAAPRAAIGAARARLDEQGFREAWAEVRAMTPEQAVVYALEDDEASPN